MTTATAESTSGIFINSCKPYRVSEISITLAATVGQLKSIPRMLKSEALAEKKVSNSSVKQSYISGDVTPPCLVFQSTFKISDLNPLHFIYNLSHFHEG